MVDHIECNGASDIRTHPARCVGVTILVGGETS